MNKDTIDLLARNVVVVCAAKVDRPIFLECSSTEPGNTSPEPSACNAQRLEWERRERNYGDIGILLSPHTEEVVEEESGTLQTI